MSLKIYLAADFLNLVNWGSLAILHAPQPLPVFRFLSRCIFVSTNLLLLVPCLPLITMSVITFLSYNVFCLCVSSVYPVIATRLVI